MLFLVKSSAFNKVISKGGDTALKMPCFNDLTKTCPCSDGSFFAFAIRLPEADIV